MSPSKKACTRGNKNRRMWRGRRGGAPEPTASPRASSNGDVLPPVKFASALPVLRPALQPPGRRTGAQAKAFGCFPPRCSGHDGFDNTLSQVIRIGLRLNWSSQNPDSVPHDSLTHTQWESSIQLRGKHYRKLKRARITAYADFQLAQKCICGPHSSGDIASPLPNWPRCHEERRIHPIGGCLPKAFCPMYRRTRSCWKSALAGVLGRGLLLRATCVMHVVDIGKVRAECLNAHWFMSLDDAGENARLGVETTTRSDLTARSATKPRLARKRPAARSKDGEQFSGESPAAWSKDGEQSKGKPPQARCGSRKRGRPAS
jgi:hypothetical protein